MNKETVYALEQSQVGLWDVNRKKTRDVKDFRALAGQWANYDRLRTRTTQYKQFIGDYATTKAKRKGKDPVHYDLQKTVKKHSKPIHESQSKFYGRMEREKYHNFKSIVTSVKADKPTKHTIIHQANDQAQRYQLLTQQLKSSPPDRRTSLKALKHVNLRLDPRASMTDLTGQAWFIQRQKPNGDRKLRESLTELKKSRDEAYRTAVFAYAKSSTQ